MYKLTNLVNGKIYIGCHMTKNLDDNYMGSGRRLGYAKKKYGIENFKKEILSTHETLEEMLTEEARLVNEEFLGRDDVYNLTLGGRGGWHYVQITKCNTSSPGYRRHVSSGGAKRSLQYARSFQTHDIISKRSKRSWELHHDRLRLIAIENGVKSMASKESNEKRKQTFKEINHQSGDKNSQYGKSWIYNEELKQSKTVSKDSIQSFIDIGWKLGRKMKF